MTYPSRFGPLRATAHVKLLNLSRMLCDAICAGLE